MLLCFYSIVLLHRPLFWYFIIKSAARPIKFNFISPNKINLQEIVYINIRPMYIKADVKISASLEKNRG